MNNIPISKLPRITAEDLLDHDLLVISQEHLERDEDGEMVLKRTVAIPLSELKRYLNGSHVPPMAVTESIGVNREQMQDDFMKRFHELAGVGGKSRDGNAEWGAMEYSSFYGGGPPVKVSSGFTEETLKQALDDAKAVKATSLANAKAIMEKVLEKLI